MNRRIAICICAVVIGFLALLGLAQCTFDRFGMKLLHMDVYEDDQLVPRTIFDAPDREGPVDFWRRAGAEPFAAEAEVAQVKADEDNPLRATLTEPVRIKIVHVDRLMADASLTNLVLLRSAPESLKWYLAPEEVQRAKRAADL